MAVCKLPLPLEIAVGTHPVKSERYVVSCEMRTMRKMAAEPKRKNCAGFAHRMMMIYVC